MRLRSARAYGADAVGAVVPHEDIVRLRACHQPTGGQVDALPPERGGQGESRPAFA